MRIFEHLNVDFMGKRNILYIVSATLFFIGLVNVIFRGFEFGIDFKGGTEIVVQFEKPVDVARVRGYLSNIGLGNVEIKTFGTETGILIRTEEQTIPANIYRRVISSIDQEINKLLPGIQKTVADSSLTTVTYQFPNPDTTDVIISGLASSGFQAGRVSDELSNNQAVIGVGISDWIKMNLREKISGNSFEVLRSEAVGPKVGNELKQDAVIAIFLSLLAILLYLAFRFKFIFAISAVAALFHDVLITLGLYAALYDVIPGLNLEIDLTVVAAFLTLIGYSINDTVIVFDRVRENLKIHKTMPLFEVMNLSVNKTMSRTLLTGGTTLMCLLVLLIFGGEVLRAFSFTLFFGIIIGTYSSIFVASAFVLEYASRAKHKIQF